MSDLSALNEIPDPVEPEAKIRREGGPLQQPQRPAPTRSTAERRRTAALCISLAWLCAHLAMYGIRQDFGQLPATYIAGQVLSPILFATCCLVVALAPGQLGLGVSVALVGVMALLGPASFWLMALGLPMPHPSLPTHLGFWLGSLVCLGITLSWVAAPLLFLAFALRGAFAAHAARRSALVGAALGLLSGAAINLHCSIVDPMHMIIGHGVPILLAVAFGAFMLVRWTRA